MSGPQNLLDLLRQRTTVDCDCMDASVPQKYGPFVDCTSNQAIAFSELQHDRHKQLILDAAKHATELASQYKDLRRTALATDISMVLLQLQIAPHISGCIHIQANPYDAYSTRRTIDGASRVIALVQHLQPDFDAGRICIKIPSTWEGLQACRMLEHQGIKTLATTPFCMEQAIVAGEAGCHYLAPYVNELRVHIDADYKDEKPNLDFVVAAQTLYEQHGMRTQVLPASLTSIQECMAMAGAKHITISPPLLKQLHETKPTPDVEKTFPSMFPKEDQPLPEAQDSTLSLVDDENSFRIRMTRRDDGRQEVKLIQAINIFCDMQDKLEEMMQSAIDTL